MYKDLLEKDKKKAESKINELRAPSRTNADLEDGEIASEREERREPRREPRRDEWRDERHERREELPHRRNYYENGDRLRFDKHRNSDRSRPLSWQHGRSPRHTPY